MGRWAIRGLQDGRSTTTKEDVEYPEFILDISRPSVGVEKAWIHAGGNPAPLIGSGETTVWERQADGRWMDTQEVVARWIT